MPRITPKRRIGPSANISKAVPIKKNKIAFKNEDGKFMMYMQTPAGEFAVELDDVLLSQYFVVLKHQMQRRMPDLLESFGFQRSQTNRYIDLLREPNSTREGMDTVIRRLDTFAPNAIRRAAAAEGRRGDYGIQEWPVDREKHKTVRGVPIPAGSYWQYRHEPINNSYFYRMIGPDGVTIHEQSTRP